jgi:hypothetical protein
MIHYLKNIVLILLVLLLTNSCREEVIPPDNFVERINDPVQVRERNSYIFLLNAENFTMNLTVPSIFTSIRTRFNITLIDYQSGYTTISVLDNNSIERFRYFIADEVSYHSALLDGFVPSNITIRTQNFSGKVKIEFRRTL